jgi:hypothetical protein
MNLHYKDYLRQWRLRVIYLSSPHHSIVYEGITWYYVLFLTINRNQADTCKFLTQSRK